LKESRCVIRQPSFKRAERVKRVNTLGSPVRGGEVPHAKKERFGKGTPLISRKKTTPLIKGVRTNRSKRGGEGKIQDRRKKATFRLFQSELKNDPVGGQS